MVQNSAFLALLTVFLLVGWFAGEVRFLAPFKAGLFALHGQLIVGAILLAFLNLCAVYYTFARWLFQRDAGRKLSHVDRQLTTSDTALDTLGQHLEEDRPDVA
jgi:hypothetical protein